MSQKLRYFLRSAMLYASPSAHACPNCGSSRRTELDRKYFFTRLARCQDCALQFRTPIDGERYNAKFYNYFYTQGITMELPGAAELQAMKASRFAGLWSDYSGYISFLDRHAIKPPQRLFDFGCSWGYGSYQFAQAGFDTYSYEIGEQRRNYGIENLGVRHIDDPYAIKPGHPLYQTFDCFFSAHVLEHVPAPSKIIDLAWNCLKPGGAFVAFTPNGCDAHRRYDLRSWHGTWGGVHPNFLDDVFYDRHFARSQHVFEARDGGDVIKQYELGFLAIKDSAKGGF